MSLGWAVIGERRQFGLYLRLFSSLARIGIDGLRVRYRHPTDLLECVFDTLAGVAFLKEKCRTKAIRLVGHSFGGAVVIQAAVQASDIVSNIVILAPILSLYLGRFIL
jgi:alpha-beta hydrolase superfamily lysophospholipase